jgi:hypothetical protein
MTIFTEKINFQLGVKSVVALVCVRMAEDAYQKQKT